MPVQFLGAAAANFWAYLAMSVQVLGAAVPRPTADTIFYGLARIVLKRKSCFFLFIFSSLWLLHNFFSFNLVNWVLARWSLWIEQIGDFFIGIFETSTPLWKRRWCHNTQFWPIHFGISQGFIKNIFWIGKNWYYLNLERIHI